MRSNVLEVTKKQLLARDAADKKCSYPHLCNDLFLSAKMSIRSILTNKSYPTKKYTSEQKIPSPIVFRPYSDRVPTVFRPYSDRFPTVFRPYSEVFPYFLLGDKIPSYRCLDQIRCLLIQTLVSCLDETPIFRQVPSVACQLSRKKTYSL